ncbi:hypothetical protein V8D89_001384 [Ganoderma adspersum]
MAGLLPLWAHPITSFQSHDLSAAASRPRRTRPRHTAADHNRYASYLVGFSTSSEAGGGRLASTASIEEHRHQEVGAVPLPRIYKGSSPPPAARTGSSVALPHAPTGRTLHPTFGTAAPTMKLALISAPLVLVFALGAHAQFQSYGIPSCATACIEQAALQGRCGFTDIPCICKALDNPPVLRTAVMCEAQGCQETRTGGDSEEGAPSALAQFFVEYCQR